MKAREYRTLCQIATDSWTGHHLLCPRPASYKKLCRELGKAFKAKNPNNRQKELVATYIRIGGDI